jgi:D-alanine-D-alanine ligase
MKKNIAVIYGGDSGEFDVSVMSGKVVWKHLDRELFDPYLILVRDGKWTYENIDGRTFPINKEDFSLHLDDQVVRFDAIFNAIHGTPGEDGKFQGYLEMLRMPVTSSDLATSSITFNKHFCNGFVRNLGVRVSRSVIIDSKSNWTADSLLSRVQLPVFVKPNRGGSSVGTSKVSDVSRLVDAVELAFQSDRQVMVEEFIPGREITCGIIPWKGSPLALPLTEIVSKKEFFDYEAKYLGKSDELTPAPIPEEVAEECRKTSLMLYRELNCRGIVRCDYIFNDDGLFFLEVNTVPGLSEPSIVPQQAAAHGISLKEMFTEAILDAIARQ